ncbi:MAG: UPF0280 family protein [Alphaproteobacteria bacterium]
MNGPTAAMLPDGRRLHLQHGPIDLVIGADGEAAAVAAAYDAARRRFATILLVLVEELAVLRSPCPPEGLGLHGPVARRMEAAVLPFAGGQFVTPMAAVAGAVADEMLAAMVAAAPLARAYVNDGGDIALHLTPGTRFDLKIAALDNSDHGRVAIAAEGPVRGVATSGRGGRSLSLGIAEAVTVLARTAAAADAAATLIANAVDLPGHGSVARAPASSLRPDSDLGDRLVVVGCGALSNDEIALALDRGLATAHRMQAAGSIEAAALFLQGESRATLPIPSWPGLSRASLADRARPSGDCRDKRGHDAPIVYEALHA